MNIRIPRPVDLDVVSVTLDIPLRHLGEKDHIADDFPGRHGDRLQLTIGMDDGKIRDWPPGRAEFVHEKVEDGGTYTLMLSDGDKIVSEGDYVPTFFPGQHFGDYVILNIDGEGRVAGWRPDPEEVADWNEYVMTK